MIDPLTIPYGAASDPTTGIEYCEGWCEVWVVPGGGEKRPNQPLQQTGAALWPLGKQRVPCSNWTIRELRTVYATAR
jgi:hypothetical protein